ncbi:MAG: hypothetical protein J6T64_05400 [Bacteroidaceae bacterium]|nr:hypothetical protein [Bacteroidaceae bacterium]
MRKDELADEKITQANKFSEQANNFLTQGNNLPAQATVERLERKHFGGFVLFYLEIFRIFAAGMDYRLKIEN